jgi:hypothetical protein
LTQLPKPSKAPCGTCPYRRDVPPGVWSAEEYAKLPRYDGETGDQIMQGGTGLFFCHQNDGKLCAGWVGCHDTRHLAALRFTRVDPSVFDYAVRIWPRGRAARPVGCEEPGAGRQGRHRQAGAEAGPVIPDKGLVALSRPGSPYNYSPAPGDQVRRFLAWRREQAPEEQWDQRWAPTCRCCGEVAWDNLRCTKHQDRNPCVVEGCTRTMPAHGWPRDDAFLCG